LLRANDWPLLQEKTTTTTKQTHAAMLKEKLLIGPQRLPQHHGPISSGRLMNSINVAGLLASRRRSGV